MYEAIGAAVRALAGQDADYASESNDVGYNKADSWFGHSLARLDSHEWTDEVAAEAYVMLRKYRTQLAGHGIDYGALPVPPLPLAEGETRTRRDILEPLLPEYRQRLARVQQQKTEADERRRRESMRCVKDEGHQFALVLGRTRPADLMNAVRSIPGRRWGSNRADAGWEIPATPQGAKGILDLLHTYGAEIGDDSHPTDGKFGLSGVTLSRLQDLVASAPKEALSSRAILAEDGQYLVRWNYEDERFSEILAAVKSLPTQYRMYEPSKRGWMVTNEPTIIAQLLRIADQYGFVLPDDLAAQRPAIMAEAKRQMDEAERAAQESMRAQERNARLQQERDIDLDLPGVARDLFGFQKVGVKYVVDNCTPKKGVIIGDDMGLGKTTESIVAMHLLDAYPLLIVTTASVKYQFADEFRTILPGKSVSIADGKTIEMGHDAVVINYDVLTRQMPVLKAYGFKGMIVDECHRCFPYATRVLTDQGEMPIGAIVDGQLAVRVAAQSQEGDIEWKDVTGWFKNPPQSLVRVVHEYGSFICSAYHRIWTTDGYTEAIHLPDGANLRVVPAYVHDQEERKEYSQVLFSPSRENGDECATRGAGGDFGSTAEASNNEDLRLVRDIVLVPVAGMETQPATVLRGVLLGEVADVTARKTGTVERDNQNSARKGTGDQAARHSGENAPQQPDEKPGGARASATGEFRADIFISWGERPTDPAADRLVPGAFRCSDGVRDLHISGEASLPIFAQPLQSGYRVAGREAGNRGRRPVSHNQEVEVSRPQEGIGTAVSRVVRVEVLESGDRRGPDRSGRADQFLYDIEVADHHNYFAEGVLVSNCKSRKAKRSKAVKELADVIPYVVGLTGTVTENRMAELEMPLTIMHRLDYLGGWRHFIYDVCGGFHNGFGLEFPKVQTMSGVRRDEYLNGIKEFNRRMRLAGCYIRRETDDVIDLPGMEHRVIKVDIDNRTEYERARKNIIAYAAELAEKDKAFLESIAHLPEDERKRLTRERREDAAHRAEQAEVLVMMNALRQLVARGKIAAANDYIESFVEVGRKVVVMCWHTEVAEAVAAQFNAPKIVGGVDADTKYRFMQEFQTDPDCMVLVCNIVAASEGLNLTAAADVVFLEQGWNPSKMQQAARRIRRIGQTRPTTQHHIVGQGTIDEAFVEMIRTKQLVTSAGNIGEVIEDEVVEGGLDYILASLRSQ